MEAAQNKEPSLYRDILKRAWSVVWRYKFLFIFGFFAALAANGEQFDVISKNYEATVRLQDHLNAADGNFLTYVKQLILSGSFLETTRLDALLFFLAVFIGPIVLSEIALIATTKQVVSGEGRPNFGSALGSGTRHFLPVLLLNLLTRVVIYGLLVLASYPLFQQYLASGGAKASLDALAVAAFVILIPFHIIVSFLAKFASVDIVLHGHSVWQGITTAWGLFVKHWLIALEMSFLLILINIAASLLHTGVFTILFTPTLGPFTTTLFLLTLFLLGSIIASFQYAAWTTLYLRFEAKTAVSKLVRWADLLYASWTTRRASPAK